MIYRPVLWLASAVAFSIETDSYFIEIADIYDHSDQSDEAARVLVCLQPVTICDPDDTFRAHLMRRRFLGQRACMRMESCPFQRLYGH